MVHHVVIVVLHVRFIGRWSFAFWFYGYKRHPTLRAFAWIIRYNFGMHRAGVFLRPGRSRRHQNARRLDRLREDCARRADRRDDRQY